LALASSEDADRKDCRTKGARGVCILNRSPFRIFLGLGG